MLKILESALIEGYATTKIDIAEVGVCLLLATLIALYIFTVYRLFARNTFYDRNFNLSLIGMSVLSASVLLTVQSSIVVSVGMVGALSIVRFRTAVKDPMDLVFLFWAIVSGIICGAGFALIAILASLVLTLILLALTKLPAAHPSQLLVINAASLEAEPTVMALLNRYSRTVKVHSRSVTASGMNLSIELRTKDEHQLIGELLGVPGIRSATMVAHDGQITV